MLNNIYPVLFYSIVAGLATLLSSYIILREKVISEKKLIYFVGFSAGALLALAFFHLIPEAMTFNSSHSLYAAVCAFVIFYLLEQQIMMHSCSEGKCSHHHIDRSKGLVGLWGIMLHSLIDGALIGTGFEVSRTLGAVTALAVLVHKIPDGISVSTIMRSSGFKRQEILKGVMLVALATPIGAVLSYLLLGGVSESVVGLALGASAGTFIYISASDLIPETHKNVNFWNSFYVVLGILFIFLARTFIG